MMATRRTVAAVVRFVYILHFSEQFSLLTENILLVAKCVCLI